MPKRNPRDPQIALIFGRSKPAAQRTALTIAPRLNPPMAQDRQNERHATKHSDFFTNLLMSNVSCLSEWPGDEPAAASQRALHAERVSSQNLMSPGLTTGSLPVHCNLR